MKFWETKTFKQLAKCWDLELIESGFVDAEKTVGEERVLIQRASNAYKQAPLVVRTNKMAYFEQLAEHVFEENFTDEVDKLVMTRYSEGVKIKQIASELKLAGHRSHRQTVRYIIRRYESKWKIRNWKPHQLSSKREKIVE